MDGFTIVGQVAPYSEEEVKVEVEPKEDEEEDSIEIKTTGKKGMEAAGAAMDAFKQDEDDEKNESLNSKKPSPMPYEEAKKFCASKGIKLDKKLYNMILKMAGVKVDSDQKNESLKSRRNRKNLYESIRNKRRANKSLKESKLNEAQMTYREW